MKLDGMVVGFGILLLPSPPPPPAAQDSAREVGWTMDATGHVCRCL